MTSSPAGCVFDAILRSVGACPGGGDSILRDQSVVITWGRPEEFRGGEGSLEIGLPKGGGFTHLKILLRGGGGSKNAYTVQLYLQYLSLTLVNMILQKLDCIATKIQK